MDKEQFEKEIKEAREAIDRKMAQHYKEHMLYMKRQNQIMSLVTALVIMLVVTAIIPLFFPTTLQYCLWIAGTCSIGVSIVNFIQFLSALTWSRGWAIVLLFLTILNMALGISKFM